MQKVINTYYLEPHECKGDYSTGFLFELEDGRTVEMMTTDPVGDSILYADDRLLTPTRKATV